MQSEGRLEVSFLSVVAHSTLTQLGNTSLDIPASHMNA